MTIKTLDVKTNSEWVDVATLFDITMTADKLYSIQVLGTAMMTYTSGTPGKDAFTISFPQPFTYKHTSGDTLYIRTPDVVGAVVTIAE